ncbi:hypothetical protein ARUE_113p00430 (plasmid) [Arthrobacter sp. Rue61a]|nr:hypothetical protein ARUE_113p00430 [Arthrobacter sp. Rue61a]
MPMQYAPWVARLADHVAAESIRAADAVPEQSAVVEKVTVDSWDALIDGAAPWEAQDEETKQLHTATVKSRHCSLRHGGGPVSADRPRRAVGKSFENLIRINSLIRRAGRD